NWKYVLAGLKSPNRQVLFDVIEGLKRSAEKPKADDPAPFRLALLASKNLDPGNRWKAVELLRHWTNNKQFGAEPGKWKDELTAWGRWFGQTFPKEPALPDVGSEAAVESKYKYNDLLAFLENEGRKGDVKRGRVAFEKAQCLKCHKYGKEGEGVGPDLT